jgi:hypothetical protein
MSAKNVARKVAGVAGWLVFLALGGLIIRNSLGYLHTPAEMPFMEEKEPISGQWFWRASLVLHVAAGIVCLVASVLQFFRGVTRRWPSLHRTLGRTYAISVLWLLCPTGAYLALFAKGGLLGQGGFLLLGGLTFFTTWRGVTEMAAGRTRAHARWMIRSFAMVVTAITFRIYHLAFSFTDWEYETNYLVSLWLSVAGNALAAEWLARMIPLHTTNQRSETHHEPKIHHPELTGAGYS